MAVDLSASYGGIKLKNPIMGGSSPVTQSPEICRKGSDYGAAGLVLKTSFSEIPELRQKTVGHPCYKMADFSGLEPWRPIPPKRSDPARKGKKGTMRPPYSLVIIKDAIPVPAFWQYDDYVRHYKEVEEVVSPDCLVVPSLYAATDEEWDAQCRRTREMGAKAVELNLACPIVAGMPGLMVPGDYADLKPGEPPSARPSIARRITKFCVERLDIPVVVKVHPFSFFNIDTALAVQEVGAQGIMLSDSNTGPMLMIDPETATPGWHPDFPTTSGGWGRWIIQHLCGVIFQMRQAGVRIDITGCGGIADFKDIVRYIMAGASSVQVARTLMAEGWVVASDWLEELPRWMAEKGYKSLMEMKGIAADKVVTDPTKLPLVVPQIMGGPPPREEIALSEEKCIGCGWCAAACTYCAIEMVNEDPVFDRRKCEVCGQCEALCPVGALSIQPVAG